MTAKVRNAINDTQFIDECKSFTCQVRRDMGQCGDAVPKQIEERLETLEPVNHLFDVPLIGTMLLWIAGK